MIRFGIIVFFFMLAGHTGLFAQQVRDPFHDSEGNSYHQLFLDFRATEIIELKYATDGTDVQGTLSVDGYSVVIKNYPGDCSVKVKARDEAGLERETTRSKCFIDPVLLEL
jgi:hypothetical protein